eukprot:c15660_g1_i1.p1 GENE.c15660_g1_i1~~c15660_g1_i1.p1  ORF type:complete len:298 (+),score=96.58 c15660_g1_i1:61-954(+)
MSGDPLFVAKAHFYLGNFQLAINEALNFKSEQHKSQRDVLVMQAYIAQGNHQMVIDQVDKNAPPQLQALKLFATFLSSESARESVVSQIRVWVNDTISTIDPVVRLVAATIFLQLGDKNEALKSLQNSSTLENLSLSAQIFISMNRIDLASAAYKQMAKIDEDHIISQLTQAWVNLAEGGSKIDQAYYTFTELGERYGNPATTLIGAALCHMHNGKFVEAENLLNDALVKSPNNPDALANLVTCHQQMHRDEDSKRYLRQLRSQSSGHAYSQKLSELDALFDSAAQAKHNQFRSVHS